MLFTQSLWQLKKHNLPQKLQVIFYTICPVFVHHFVVSSTKHKRTRLWWTIRADLPSTQELCRSGFIKWVTIISTDPTRPGHQDFWLFPSDRHGRVTFTTTKNKGSYRDSFAVEHVAHIFNAFIESKEELNSNSLFVQTNFKKIKLTNLKDMHPT